MRAWHDASSAVPPPLRCRCLCCRCHCSQLPPVAEVERACRRNCRRRSRRCDHTARSIRAAQRLRPRPVTRCESSCVRVMEERSAAFCGADQTRAHAAAEAAHDAPRPLRVAQPRLALLAEPARIGQRSGHRGCTPSAQQQTARRPRRSAQRQRAVRLTGPRRAAHRARPSCRRSSRRRRTSAARKSRRLAASRALLRPRHTRPAACRGVWSARAVRPVWSAWPARPATPAALAPMARGRPAGLRCKRGQREGRGQRGKAGGGGGGGGGGRSVGKRAYVGR